MATICRRGAKLPSEAAITTMAFIGKDNAVSGLVFIIDVKRNNLPPKLYFVLASVTTTRKIGFAV